MQKLHSLGFIAGVAIVLSAVYALAVNDSTVDIDVKSEDGRSIRHVMSGDKGEFRFADTDLSLNARWQGDFTLSSDGNGIESLEDELEIELEDRETDARALYENKRGEIEKRFYQDGEEIEDSAEAEAAAKELLIRFLRISGLEAEDRIAALVSKGGPAGALEEIAILESDIAVRRYIQALSEDHALSDTDIAALARKLEKVESDQDLRLAISEIFENQTVSPVTSPLLLNAALNIDSDHDLRKLLESAAAAPLAGDEALPIALRLYRRIEGDHDLRKAAEALLEMDGLEAAARADILAAAASRIDSDRDMRLVLEDSAADLSSDPAMLDAWLAGFAALESGGEQRLAIEAAAASNLSDEAAASILERTELIEDSRERRQALEALAARTAQTQALTALYRTAAESIEDERERSRALDAIDADN